MGVLTFLADGDGALLADDDGNLLGADETASLPAAFYHNTIYVAPAIAPHLNAAFDDDIAPALLEATGQTFTITTTPTIAGTINVALDAGLTGQEYSITGTIGSTLNIRGGNARGCQHALYAWLEELGIMALAPTDRFKLVPTLTDIRRNLSIQRAPAFRTFARGEQGFPGGFFNVIEAVFTPWMRWIGRPLGHYTTTNLSPELQAFGGHTDGGAYGERQAEYDADPTHFAQVYPSWEPLTSYAYTERVVVNGNTYEVRSGGDGVSAASGGPSGTGTNITDGSVHWDWVRAGTRLTGIGVWHMTHEGHATGTDYSGNTLGLGVTGIRAEDLVDQIAANLTKAAAEPEIYDGLTMGLALAAADGALPCVDQKCVDLVRNITGGAATTDALPSDLFGWRNGRIWETAAAGAGFTDFEVTDYAYDLQSAPLTEGWTCNPNVRWILANWNYPRETLPAEVRLEKWDARAQLDGFYLGIYDYWSLPGHSLSDPRQSAKMMWKRIAATLATCIDTWTIETTHSIGCTALHVWGAHRMLWRGVATYEELATEWCGLAFGAGATAMKEALDYWWASEDVYFAHAYLLGCVFDAMHRADALVVADAGARSRVAAWMAFAVWTYHKARWYQHTVGELMQSRIASHAYAIGDRYQTLAGAGHQYIVTATSGAGLTASGDGPTGTGTGITDGDLTVDYYSPGADELAEDLLRHVYKTVDTHMIDIKPVAYTILIGPVSPAFAAEWGSVQDETWQIANDTLPYTDDEIRTVFDATRALYPFPDKAVHTAAVETALTAPGSPTGNTLVSSVIFTQRIETHPDGAEYIFKVGASDTGVIRIISFGLSAALAAEVVGRVNIYNASTGALVYTADTPADAIGTNMNHDITLSDLGPGFYRMRCLHYQHAVSYQGHMPIVCTTKSARIVWYRPGANEQYFNVWKGVTKFNFFTWDGLAPSMFDGDDNPVTVTRVSPNTFTVDVPVGQDQKTWKWTGAVTTAGHALDMLYWTSHSRDTMIWPTNLYTE